MLCNLTIRYFFMELLRDAPIAPFNQRFNSFSPGSTQWNKRRSLELQWFTKWTRWSSGLHFLVIFILFALYCHVVSMNFLKVKNTWTWRLFLINWGKTRIEGLHFYQNISLNKSNLLTHQHPQLKFCLSSNKNHVQHFKNDVSLVLHKIQPWLHKTTHNLLTQEWIVYPTIHVVTHHYQRFSSSQYMPQMQVQLNKTFQFPHTNNDYVLTHMMYNHWRFRHQIQHLLSQRKTQCMIHP